MKTERYKKQIINLIIQFNYTVGFITENFTTKFEVLAVVDDTKYIIFKDTKNGNGIITTFREDKLQKVELIRAIIPMEFIPRDTRQQK